MVLLFHQSERSFIKPLKINGDCRDDGMSILKLWNMRSVELDVSAKALNPSQSILADL
jgi:hypothetical protein